MVGLRSDRQAQISCGQVLVLQSRQSGHNTRSERVVPKNVSFFTTQLVQIEASCSAPEGREKNGSKFSNSGTSSEVSVLSDSDWAEDTESHKSSSAGVGRHLLKAYTRKQKIIVRSSAEAELYAAALGASEAKEVQSMMCDLVFAMKPVLIIDAESDRTRSSSTWNRQNEAHGRGAFVVAG